MASIIRLSNGKDWGTAFAIEHAGKLKFVTAAHVLKTCGIPSGAEAGTLEMCDQLDQQFLAGPKPYNLVNIVWKECGDVVNYQAIVNGITFWKDCALERAELSIQAPVLDLVGMSGCPIADDAGKVVAFLVGTFQGEGGPPYQSTLLP